MSDDVLLRPDQSMRVQLQHVHAVLYSTKRACDVSQALIQLSVYRLEPTLCLGKSSGKLSSVLRGTPLMTQQLHRGIYLRIEHAVHSLRQCQLGDDCLC